MNKSLIKSFLIFLLLFSTQVVAKPRCDTAHLDICTRELLQGLIEEGELNGHWDNANYLTGNLVVDGASLATTGSAAFALYSVIAKNGLYWDSTNVFYQGNTGSDIQSATQSMIHHVASYYMGGSWHTISAPMVVPQMPITQTPVAKPIIAPPLTPVAVPNKVPTVISHTLGTGNKHSKITLNNTHKKVTINYNHKHKNSVLNKKSIPPKTTSVKQTVSLQVAKLHYKNAKKIDAKNVNKHLISTVPGNNVEQNHHAVLVDHDNRAWRCKVSGLGFRNMKSKGKESIPVGHAETMHFRNSTFAHISNNIAINNNCLISVSK